MKSVEEIINALPCLALNKHPCGSCAYNPKPERTWPYGCVLGQSDLVLDAINTLKKSQTHEVDSDSLTTLDITMLDAVKSGAVGRFECDEYTLEGRRRGEKG